MKKLFNLLWALCFLLPSCTSKTSESTTTTDSVVIVDGAPETPQTASPSLVGLTNLIDKKDQVLPSEYCELLGIVPCMDFVSCMEVKSIDGVNYFLALTASTGATDTNSQAQIFLLEFNESQVLNISSFDINYQKKPMYTFLHNTFFLTEMEMKEYEENEAGAMNDTGKPPWVERECRVVFNGKISSLSANNKSELQLLRNLIFARYGYQFKSDSLKSYFSKYDWYKPINSDVNNQLTDTDKILIDLIKKEETSK